LRAETISLIQQMAKEDLLRGAERIHGGLLKLGIQGATATVQKYLHLARPTRAPDQNWSVFSRIVQKDVWARDFLPVIDLFFRRTYLFSIVELALRRIVHFI
jgi:hypothetical protein